MKRKRYRNGERKGILLEAGIQAARTSGWRTFNRKEVGQLAGVNGQMIYHYWDNMDAYRDDVMRAAIERRELGIILHGLTWGHPAAKRLPDDIKKQAAQLLPAGV